MLGKLSSIRVGVSAPLLKADEDNPSVGPVNSLLMNSENTWPSERSVRATVALEILSFHAQCLC